MIRSPTRSVVSLLLCLLLAGCARSELLQALDERQANEVVAALLHHNIPAEKRLQGKAGFMVRVAAADLAEAIDLVQLKGLPSAPRTQIAAQFPADAMVSTPLAERARLLSAIEQRLEESLTTLAGVKRARARVSYDAGPTEGSLQQRRAPSMHVAAVLAHSRDMDQAVLLATAKRFLRNAFVDVAYDNVSVVLTPAAEPRSLAVTPADEPTSLWALLVIPLGLLAALAACGWWLLQRGDPRAVRVRERLRRRRRPPEGASSHA